MNPASGGQTPQPAPGQPGAPGPSQRAPPMYHPNQIRHLPMLSEEEKSKYELGLRGLWSKVNTTVSNSSEQLAARNKIMEFSRMLITKIQTRRTQAAQQQVRQQGQPSAPSRPTSSSQQNPGPQQQGSAGQQLQPQPQLQPPQPQPQQPQQPQPQPQQTQPSHQPQPSQQPQQPQQQQQKQPEQGTTGSAAPIQGDTTMGGTPGAQMLNTQGAASAAQRTKVPDQYLQRANEINWHLLVQHNNKTPSELARMREEMREKYARAMWRNEQVQKQLASLDAHMNERKASGHAVSDEEMKQYQTRRDMSHRSINETQKYIDSVRRQQETLQIGAQQQPQLQHQPQQQVGAKAGLTAQQPIDAQQLQTAGTAAGQKLTPGGNQGLPAAADAARKQHANRASPALATPMASTQSLPQAQSRSVTNPAQMPGQQQQGHGAEQAHPSPVNPGFPPMAQKQGQAQSPAPGQAARGQPPQAVPPGPARTLSHSAAMSLANQRASSTPGGPPLPNQHSSAVAHSQAGAHQHGHPHAHPPQQQQPLPPPPPPQQQQQQQQTQQPPTQAQSQPQPHPHPHPQTASQAQIQPHPSSQTQSQQSIVSKMPIPKQLPEKATSIPQGVNLGGGVNPGRPTMTQGSGTLGGIMNQPAVSRVDAYNHDAEGDHVLSKKKLDELVRQVCGGSPEGYEGSLLAPEVEENVLNMADMFVDGVLQDACRNAKERGSKVLEIRDIQMVLERTYNIRVPGYSSDELRTVRRVQPAPGWIAKMSAVQAAKVMPGKGDL